MKILQTGGTSFGRHLVRDLDLKVSVTTLETITIPIAQILIHVSEKMHVPKKEEEMLLLQTE